MTRVKNTPVKHSQDKKILKQAKGYRGLGRKSPKKAKELVMRSLVYSYAHRKKRYSFFRNKVWIPRLNAELRDKYGLRYSWFIHLLGSAQIKLNRKQLSEMIIKQPDHFAILIKKLKTYDRKINSQTGSLVNSASH